MTSEPQATSAVDIHLNIQGPAGRRVELMRSLRDAIESGRLTPGTRLPSYRVLAGDLGIARNTVAEAYAQLVEEGWLMARQGSGTRVAPRATPTTPHRRRRPPHPSKEDRPLHDLTPSSPDPGSFPRVAWLQSTRRAINQAPNDAFGVPDPRGRPELRHAVVEYLGRTRGVRATPEQVVICSGVAQSLDLIVPLLGGTIAVEAYGLGFHREIIEQHQPTNPIPLDQDGLQTDLLASTDTVGILLTPAHQFPTGGPLHPDRRAAVVDWARSNAAVILEDDYDGEFRYDRQPIGAIQGLDPECVVYLGSTSKSLTPALRLGWIVAPDWLVTDIVAAKGPREQWTGVHQQLTLADFMASGSYDRHIRRMRQTYRHRRDRLTRTLAAHAPHVAVSGIAAGLHAVLSLPHGKEPQALESARRHRLALDGLDSYRHPGSAASAKPGIVVGYGTPNSHSYEAALRALTETLSDSSIVGPDTSGYPTS